MGTMSVESVASRTPYRQMHARGGNLGALANRALLLRIWRFAGRHRRTLAAFVDVSVVSALLTVAAPILAGKVVNAIVHGGPAATVVLLAVTVAAVAVVEAAVSLITRWLCSTIGEGLSFERVFEVLDLVPLIRDHKQLLGRGGRYAELYVTQFGEEAAAA